MIVSDAKKGVVTPTIEAAANYEGMDPERLRRLVADGRAVIPRNINHSFSRIRSIGKGLRVKVNVNIGTSADVIDVSTELEKLNVALKFGTDSIMDLSTGGDLREFRRIFLDRCDTMFGTVPVYQSAVEKAREPSGAVVDMTSEDMFHSIESHAKDGVDFITVHCGVTREVIETLRTWRRKTGVVSRGGAIHLAWMIHHDIENPLYSDFDHLLDIAREYDLTLSLGDGLRPGGVADATDGPQITELITLAKLVRRARSSDVQVMVEGPGHIPLNQIEGNIALEKALCADAPFYVLGPIVTDVFPGYDHITSAIGGAVAGLSGADFLCSVTPSEHLSLPSVQDIKDGLIASRIAAHAVDLTRGIDFDVDVEMDRARYDLDWSEQYRLCYDADKALSYRSFHEGETCSMCGDYCALKLARRFLDGS